jgi:alpha-glucosidase
MADTNFIPTEWWQTGVIYQVYPRSFQDTDGDGVGDLPGITARLDYLVGLGVDALWISPFYPSPMADFGYDVSNYTDVDPLFGTLADFDALLAAAHRKGLRVILDFVPNHTSDRHPWFVESRSSRDHPKRDWYLWHDAVPYPWLAPGEDTRPVSEQHPNNWQSHFGGPAWTWDEATRQFYLHSFLAEQPDLNWRNPQVRAAVYAAMRFWLERGVDGFRMDVLWLLIKDAEFRNNTPAETFNADQPETLAIVAEMRALLDTYPDALGAPFIAPALGAMSGETQPPTPATSSLNPKPYPLNPISPRLLIGEIYLPLPQLIRYYGAPHLSGANLPFNFHLIQSPWTAEAIAEIIRSYESLLPAGAWPNYVLGNHDQSRLATRVGPVQARAAAMLLLTLRGTPTLYYGDELGMTDVPIAPDQVRDPAAKNDPSKGRDPERSPMLWVEAPNAGFTPPGVVPWLPLQADWPTQNAAAQSRFIEGQPPRSMLTLYRKLLALRRLHDTLHAGAIADVSAEGTILRYRRVGLPDGSSGDFQILLNLGPEPAVTHCAPGEVLLTTLLDGEGARTGNPDTNTPAPITLEAGEGLLVALD